MVQAGTQNYDVPFTYRKYFNTEQVTEMINAFKSYDVNGDGTIDAREFKAALNGMGHTDITDTQVAEMLARVDKNADGVIEWIEFLDMMQLIKKSGQTNFGAAVTTKSG
jgi:Ca2+-binding EF-hand superfamily protein